MRHSENANPRQIENENPHHTTKTHQKAELRARGGFVVFIPLLYKIFPRSPFNLPIASRRNVNTS